jgi:HEAT repeat protein
MTGDEDDDGEVPEVIEDVIELLLSGLQDKDTIVRWSAAKGLGRITQRLPQNLAEDIVDSINALLSDNTFINDHKQFDLSAVSDQSWHGVCLSIAELARRGLLLPDRIAQVLSWVGRVSSPIQLHLMNS